jgi:hypothetical protein
VITSTGSIRIVALATGVAALAVAFGIRAVAGGNLFNNGALQQNSGTALYASAVYAGVVFIAPRIRPVAAGLIALGWCWAVEFLQLTAIPRELSAMNLLLRFIFGTSFDWTDVWWYPAGIAPLLLIDHVTKLRAAREPVAA